MSASRERKKRVEQNSNTQPESAKAKKKISEGWIFAICMISIVVIVIGGMLIYRNYEAHQTVLTVGDYEVEVYEFNYFYREIAAVCDQYQDYLGLDETALDKQKIDSSDLSMMALVGLNTECLADYQPVDGVYDFTWAELIADNAMRNAASAYSVYQAAVAAGYELTAEEQESIDESVAEIKTYADENSMSVDEYIEAVFGRDCDEESYRQYMKVISIASSYPATIEYTAEEMAARDEEAPEDFDAVAFYYYVMDGTTIKAEQDAAAETTEEETEETTEEETVEATEEETAEATEEETAEATEEDTAEATEEDTAEATEEDTAEATEEETEEETEVTDEETTEETEEELTEEQKAELDKLAKEAAEKMAADFDVNADSVAIHADYTREYLESISYTVELPEEAIDWLYGEAKADEVKMFTIEADEELEDDENRYVVIKFISGEDYNTANFLSLTIADDEEDVELEEGEKTAQEKVAEIKASLEADSSEENFRNLILANLDHEDEEGEEHDHSQEGVSENQTRYTLANTSKDVFAWMMLEARAQGDWTMIDMDGQTVFYFYLGEGEGYRHLSIESTMRSEWYTETTEAAIEACGYDKDAAMSAEVRYYS